MASPQPNKEEGREAHPATVGRKKIFSRRRAVLAVIILLLLGVGGWLGWNYYQRHRWTVDFEYPLSRSSAEIIQDLNKSLTPDPSSAGSGEASPLESGHKSQNPMHDSQWKEDSIDGVAMHFCSLAGLQASISRGMPAYSDSTVVLITQAWDYYFDDAGQYHFLGDFIYNGKSLARGAGKAGFVAVTKNGWQMGVSQNDSVRDYVISQGGSMFRQFALVSAGQICLKQFALKGKVHRRALARKPGEATAFYVETVNKESLYDFAEALADYGFIDAIYLTGADGTGPAYRDGDGTLHGHWELLRGKSNLLVFRRAR